MTTLISIIPQEVPYNPWARSVSTLSDFLYYCCPECDMIEKDKNVFIKHAILNHESAGVLKVFYAEVIHEEKELPETTDTIVPGENEIVKEEPFEPKSDIKHEDGDEKEHESSELVRGKPDQVEIPKSTALQESVVIKEEVDLDMFEENSNDDDQASDPLDNTDTNEDQTEPELVQEDYPIIKLPSTLSRKELQVLYQKHKVEIPKKLSLTQLAERLERTMKKQHPLRQHLSKMSLNELRDFHEFAIGEIYGSTFTQSDRLQRRIANHYFERHRKSPLTSFLKDKEVSQDPLRIQPKVQSKAFDFAKVTVTKRDPNDPSVVVDPATPKRQLIAELMLPVHGYKMNNLYFLNRDKCQELLEKSLKRSHPIHKVIAKLSEEDMKALLCYCGDFSKCYGVSRHRGKKIYNFFANRIFKAKPQSPLTYLTELQSKYKNNGIEGHQKLLKKLKVIAKRQRKALKSKIQHENEPTDPFAN